MSQHRCMTVFGVVDRKTALEIIEDLRIGGVKAFARKAPKHMGEGYMIYVEED